jgi:hypothetical protein
MKPVTITNTFGPQTGPIPLSELDTNFSELSASLNDMGTYSNYVTDLSSSANLITVTTAVGLAFAYSAGMLLQVVLANTNTSTTVNINVNGLGNQLVVTNTGAGPAVGALLANSILLLQYNGTEFVLIADASGARTGSFTATLTGMTGATTGLVYYAVSGSIVTLSCTALTGTSNSTVMTMTGLPAALQPASQYQAIPVNLENGTADILGMAYVTPGGGTISFYPSVASGWNNATFAATGTKGLTLFSLTYSLL